jgi:tetratricopeptide (TPR) repeat protein
MKDSFQLKRLGEMYIEQGDLESAELLLRKALSIDELLVPDTVALAEDLFNLGLLCYSMDNHSEATDFLMKAWKIERSLLGDLHSETLNTFNVLSEIHADREGLTRGGRLYQAARTAAPNSHVYH